MMYQNFVSQLELMNLKQDMEDTSGNISEKVGGRISTRAVEEIHQMYTEGNKINLRMVCT